MKSDSDWRGKYLDTVDKLESIERDWKALEAVFRTLTSRLCLAAQGRDERLDEALKRVSERIRAKAEAPELLELIDPLSSAIAALDAGPAPVASVTSTHTNIKVAIPLPAPPATSVADSQSVRSAAVAAALKHLSSLPELAPALNPL